MSNNHFCWDQTKDERLIEMVELMPELHDVNSPKYRDVSAKRSGWQKIGATLMIEPYKCEERWEYLKAVQRRRDSMEAGNSQTGSASSDWKIISQMCCNEYRQNKRKLRAVDLPNKIKQTNEATNGDEQTRKTLDAVKTDLPLREGGDLIINIPEEVLSPTNINSEENLTDNEKSSQTSSNENLQTPPVDNGNGEYASHDSIDIFFLLMANLMKGFDKVDQHLIKVKLFELVHKTEAKYILNQNLNQQNSSINPSRNSSPPHSPLMPALPTRNNPQGIPNRRVSELQNAYDDFYNPPK